MKKSCAREKCCSPGRSALREAASAPGALARVDQAWNDSAMPPLSAPSSPPVNFELT